MITLCVGDTHGKSFKDFVETKGKKIIYRGNNSPVDCVVFMGDYCDQGEFIPDLNMIVQTTTNQTIFQNLLDIVEFKKQFGDRVVLLVGNHDYHYMYQVPPCSGYRNAMHPPLSVLFGENRQLFTYAHHYKNFLFTHAGLTESFYENQVQPILEKHVGIELEDALNIIGNKPDVVWYSSSPRRGGSPFKIPSFLWADKKDLIEDPYPNMIQVVGHTRVKSTESYVFEEKNSHIFFIDHLDSDNPESCFLLDT